MKDVVSKGEKHSLDRLGQNGAGNRDRHNPAPSNRHSHCIRSQRVVASW